MRSLILNGSPRPKGRGRLRLLQPLPALSKERGLSTNIMTWP